MREKNTRSSPVTVSHGSDCIPYVTRGMNTFGAHVAPSSVEYEKETRWPPPLCVNASFHPTKTRPWELIAIVGSTWYRYVGFPEFTRTFGEKGASSAIGGSGSAARLVGRSAAARTVSRTTQNTLPLIVPPCTMNRPRMNLFPTQRLWRRGEAESERADDVQQGDDHDDGHDRHGHVQLRLALLATDREVQDTEVVGHGSLARASRRAVYNPFVAAGYGTGRVLRVRARKPPFGRHPRGAGRRGIRPSRRSTDLPNA